MTALAPSVLQTRLTPKSTSVVAVPDAVEEVADVLLSLATAVTELRSRW